MSYFVFLLAALAVAGLGCVFRRRAPALSATLIGLGCVGLVGVIGWQLRQSLFSPDSQPPNRANVIVSYFLAEQTLDVVGAQAGAILVIFPPEKVMNNTDMENYLDSYSAPVLRGHPALKVESVRLEMTAKEAKSGAIPIAAFKKALGKNPAAIAFVSYAGIPDEFEQIRPAAAQNLPPFFIFDARGSASWVSPLKSRLIDSVIVPRPDVDLAAMSGIGGPPSVIFDRLYLMATPGTADQVAAKLAKH